MASYRISWKRAALKEVQRLPKQTVTRVVKVVEALAENPYPSGVKKLIGAETVYRVRVGNYRIIYSVETTNLVVEIIRVRHRSRAYRA